MRRSKEYMNSRLEELIDYIEQNGNVTVTDLVDRFHLSPSTVRRALESLEQKGLAIRTHGGVKSLQRENCLSLEIKPNVNNIVQKNRIAQRARKLIKNGDVIALGCGSTTLFLAKLLHGMDNLTVITDSAYVAVGLMEEENIEIYLSGGIIHSRSGAVYSAQCKNLFESALVNKVFIGADGISLASRSITAMAHLTEAERMILTCGEKVYVLADNSKFDKKTVIERLASFNEFDYLITDRKPSDDIIEKLEEYDIKVLY